MEEADRFFAQTVSPPRSTICLSSVVCSLDKLILDGPLQTIILLFSSLPPFCSAPPLGLAVLTALSCNYEDRRSLVAPVGTGWSGRRLVQRG